MKIKIIGVETPGRLETERLVLLAREDLNIGDYIILRTDVGSSPESGPYDGDIKRAFWFEKFNVKKNDYVVLYSKSGSRKSKAIGADRTSHFFYWGSNSSIWGTGYAPVVAEAPQWDFHEINEDTIEPAASNVQK